MFHSIVDLLTCVCVCVHTYVQFWHISPVDELLARMENDSLLVVKRVCSLLAETVSPSQSVSEQLERCVAVVGTNRLASWRFYQVAVSGMACKNVGKA